MLIYCNRLFHLWSTGHNLRIQICIQRWDPGLQCRSLPLSILNSVSGAPGEGGRVIVVALWSPFVSHHRH